MKKKLNGYKGKLSAVLITDGMNAAIKNARRLLEDAETLLSGSRFPTAASLAILSIEEAGKVHILRHLAVAKSESEIIEVWANYRSHTHKNVLWILPELAASGARRAEELGPIFDENSDHPFILDQLKQLGFYTDCLGKGRWAIPEDIIDEKLASTFVAIARLLVRDRTYSVREIELWIQHIRPVWKGNPRWIKQALINWQAAMQEARLAPDGPNEMQEFLKGVLKGRT